MADPIRLLAPLPDNALEAELTWLAPRAGLRPGDEAVERHVAQRATLRVKGLDERWELRKLELSEADAWLTQARRLHADMAVFDARTQTRAAERGRDRAELAATIVPRCQHCGEVRAYAGRRDVVIAGRPEQVYRTGRGLERTGTTTWHVYACPRCGSVELFAAGALDHPLPGAA